VGERFEKTNREALALKADRQKKEWREQEKKNGFSDHFTIPWVKKSPRNWVTVLKPIFSIRFPNRPVSMNCSQISDCVNNFIIIYYKGYQQKDTGKKNYGENGNWF